MWQAVLDVLIPQVPTRATITEMSSGRSGLPSTVRGSRGVPYSRNVILRPRSGIDCHVPNFPTGRPTLELAKAEIGSSQAVSRCMRGMDCKISSSKYHQICLATERIVQVPGDALCCKSLGQSYSSLSFFLQHQLSNLNFPFFSATGPNGIISVDHAISFSLSDLVLRFLSNPIPILLDG